MVLDRGPARAIVGGMLAVAESDAATESDRRDLIAAWHFIFGQGDAFEAAKIRALGPVRVSAVLRSHEIATLALRFLTAIACPEGQPRPGRIEAVQAYARAFELDENDLVENAAVAIGMLRDARARLDAVPA